jgi:hypothetical protein
MKHTLFLLVVCLAFSALAGCSLSLQGKSKALSTPLLLSTPSPSSASPTASATPGLPVAAATPTTSGLVASPLGPLGVINVASGNELNLRSAPGTTNPVTGSFPAGSSSVMRTGDSSKVGSDLWVQVQNLAGGTGWVSATFLTEYVAPAAFCADGRVNTLLANFGNAVRTSNGKALAELVSPSHGMTVRLWRNGNAVTFDQAHAQWIFVSTYAHNWGAAPGSGLDTIGSIHAAVLPKWLDVLNAPGYTMGCNVPLTGGASYDTSWPAIYSNINFYSLYKPGPAGNELSWRTLLLGVEYVQNQPYIFSVTQLDWEP